MLSRMLNLSLFLIYSFFVLVYAAPAMGFWLSNALDEDGLSFFAGVLKTGRDKFKTPVMPPPSYFLGVSGILNSPSS